MRSADGICECQAGFTGGLCQWQLDAERPGYCRALGTSQFITFGHASYQLRGTNPAVSNFNVVDAGVYYLIKSTTDFQAQIWSVPDEAKPNTFIMQALFVRFGTTEIQVATSNGKIDVTYDGNHYFPPVGQNHVTQLGNLQITTQYGSLPGIR